MIGIMFEVRLIDSVVTEASKHVLGIQVPINAE